MSGEDLSVDVAVIGGGQTALAVSYFLRRTDLSYVVLDEGVSPGGAWRHGWDSLHLFSPAQWSSLPGWPMPATPGYPSRDHVVDYLASYEQRYDLPIVRPVHVEKVLRQEDGFELRTNRERWRSRAVVSATGTWRAPFIPSYPGRDLFAGEQTHSADYKNVAPYRGKKVLVIGGGNSGAQILSELSEVADVTWVTETEPVFLPDDVDGRVLFEHATAKWQAMQKGSPLPDLPGGLGNIVMLPPVKAARERGALTSVRPFKQFTPTGVLWADGRRMPVDAVIWCTGFRPALTHLAALNVLNADGKIALSGTQSVTVPRLWLMGYGDWTGFASATLIGVMRYAKATVTDISTSLQSSTLLTRRTA